MSIAHGLPSSSSAADASHGRGDSVRLKAWLALAAFIELILAARVDDEPGLLLLVVWVPAVLATGIVGVALIAGGARRGAQGRWPGWAAAGIAAPVAGFGTATVVVMTSPRGGHSMGLEVLLFIPGFAAAFLGTALAGPALEAMHPRFHTARAPADDGSRRNTILWHYLAAVWCLGHVARLVIAVVGFGVLAVVDLVFRNEISGHAVGMTGFARAFGELGHFLLTVPAAGFRYIDLPHLLLALAVWWAWRSPRARGSTTGTKIRALFAAAFVLDLAITLLSPSTAFDFLFMPFTAAMMAGAVALPWATGGVVRTAADEDWGG